MTDAILTPWRYMVRLGGARPILGRALIVLVLLVVFVADGWLMAYDVRQLDALFRRHENNHLRM